MEYELEQVLQLELGKVYELQLDMDDQLELEQEQEPKNGFYSIVCISIYLKE